MFPIIDLVMFSIQEWRENNPNVCLLGQMGTKYKIITGFSITAKLQCELFLNHMETIW